MQRRRPHIHATANDDPRIIDPVFPDRTNGQLATFAELNRDSKLSMTLTVTPADYTTCEWYLDGEKVAEGKTIEKELEAGTYDLKIVATTTAGKSTSREGLVKVKPLDATPLRQQRASSVSWHRERWPRSMAVISTM